MQHPMHDSTPHSGVRARLEAARLRGLSLAATGLILAAAAAPHALLADEAGGEEERRGPAAIADMRYVPEDLEREARADAMRDRMIEQLMEIIPTVTDPSQRADLLFQLSELWWQKSQFVYFTEMAAYDKAYEAWIEAVNRGEEPEEPVANHRQSGLYRQEAINLYQRILDEFPNYHRNDQVLFILAGNLYETDKKDQGVELYWNLIRNFPDSTYVAESYLQMGEHFFEGNRVFDAQRAYQRAHELGDERVRPFALYKLAWCDVNLGEHAAALEKLHQVVRHTEEQARASGEDLTRIQLKGEAMRDMVRVYTELDKVDEAIAYFQRHGDDRTEQYIAALAQSFYDNGKNEEAIAVFRWLINQNTSDTRAPQWQSTIVRAYANLQERQQVLAEMQRLVDLYGPNSPWAQQNAGDEAALRRAYELTEGTQRELVTEYHQEAQRTQYAHTYRLAAEIYKRYLDQFSDSEYAYNLRFYWAEILLTLEEFEDAAAQYLAVVEHDPYGEHTLTSAYNALLSYEKLAAIDRGDIQRRELDGETKIDEDAPRDAVQRQQIVRRAEAGAEARDIPRWEQKQVEASDAYVTVVDEWRERHRAEMSRRELQDLEGDEIVVRYKAAFILYEHQHYVEAARRFEEIIMRWPRDQWARTAADLILDSLNVQEEWADLNRVARRFRENTELARPRTEFTTRLDGLIEGSAFKMVLDVMAAGEERKAAEQFRAFVEEFPRSEHADRALFNAMVIYGKDNELDRAVEVGEQLLQAYQQSDLQPRVIQTLGGHYERMADYEKAARYYETFTERYMDERGRHFRALPDDVKEEVKKSLADNLFNAGLWYEGLGNYPKAIASYTRYISDFASRDDVPDIHYNVAQIYERQEDWTRASNFFESYVRDHARRLQPWQVIRAIYRQSHAQGKLGNTREVERLYGDILRRYGRLSDEDKRHPMVRRAAAHAAFAAIEADWNAYLEVRLDTTNQRDIQQRLTQKTQLLEALEQKYTAVIEYGAAEWAIASLTRIGLGYQDFARNLLDAPIPPGLTEDQEELYRALLEERAFPLEERAIEFLETAIATSSERMVYNEWTLRAQETMLAFRPNAFQEIHEVPYFGSEFFITEGPETVMAETPEIVLPPEPDPVEEGEEEDAPPAAVTAEARR
jgi:cellulose synthase operon protein C